MSIKIGNLELKSKVYIPPMAGVTDLVFRNLIRQLDQNCLLATEMVSSRGLMNNPECRIMKLDKIDHPIGIQLFGHEPEIMSKAALLAQNQGCDFIDINMGCPVPKITKGKDGCALMKEPNLAGEIVSAVKSSVSIPVTVKFRLGWDETTKNAVEFGQLMQANGASLVTVHGRTRQQLYSGKADWQFIAKVKQNLDIPVLGNGDVLDLESAIKMLEITNCDGVAIARGTMGNPWLANIINEYLINNKIIEEPNEIEKLSWAYRHALMLIDYKGLRVGINESRRHVINYTKGMLHGSVFRGKLTQITSLDELFQILSDLSYSLRGQSGLDEFKQKIKLLTNANNLSLSQV